jgi:5-methylcytosine-specific restriction endonuclease McrA
MSYVFVLDTTKQPLNPVHPGRARLLLKQGKAAVFKRYPFTLILKHSVDQPAVQPLRLKIDPGSKTTGLAIVNDSTGDVMWAGELTYRGEQIKRALASRRAARRSRRQRNTRYRPARFQNRSRRTGWLPPSLESRVANIVTWVRRLVRLTPIAVLSQELVKFDLQAIQNPDIEGIQYQQGDAAGYEVRELVLERWNRTCAYCDRGNLPLQLEHIHSRARGGTDRLSNLTLACEACNIAKGTQDIREFLKDQPERLARILAQAREPLKDASAVNATRWALYERLKAMGLPVETGSGGLTKYNRTTRTLPKAHWLDAACIGRSTPAHLCIRHISPLLITAVGRQQRQLCLVDRHGFPRTKAKQRRTIQGFQSGDIVCAVVPTGKRTGHHEGKVAVKASGYFSIATGTGVVTDIAYRFCRLVHRSDGYSYQVKGGRDFLPTV